MWYLFRRRSAIINAFNIARTTIKRWGKALKSNDSEKIARILAGPGAPIKITFQIKEFIKLRFFQIYEQTHYNYSSKIRNEIKNVFQETISSESLRPIFNELKESLKSNKQEKIKNGNISEEKYNTIKNKEKEANGCDLESKESIDTANKSKVLKEKENIDNRNHAITFSKKSNQFFCNHIGILLFCSLLNKLSCSSNKYINIIKQWFFTILAGAINIEQTKLIDSNSMKVLLGGNYYKSVSIQRTLLWEIEKKENINYLNQFNVKITNTMDCKNFYYDPHTKEYTGIKKILKGWCGSTKRPNKILNMDFIHTDKGEPLFIKHIDNFYDLRERFISIIEEFRIAIGYTEKTILTFVIDRAIYGFDVFEKIVSIENINLITWQKGYKKDLWQEEKISGSFIMNRTRNNKKDLLKYDFRYIDQKWNKNNQIRQIIVKATNPKNRTIEVSILSTDQKKCTREIIELMFKRWIQENDFKYLIEHFGINQITSYSATNYKKLLGTIEDKEVMSGAYKAIQLHYKNLKQELSQLLLKKHTNKKQNIKNDEKITSLTKELENLKDQISKTQKESSRLQNLVDEEMYKLDTANKEFMDLIKIVSRNMFYKLFEPFKNLYDNYRDDHVIFRNLTKSHGVLVSKESEVEIILFPTVQYPLKTKKIVETFLEKINAENPKMPDGSNRKITFKLGEKANNLFAISNC